MQFKATGLWNANHVQQCCKCYKGCMTTNLCVFQYEGEITYIISIFWYRLKYNHFLNPTVFVP